MLGGWRGLWLPGGGDEERLILGGWRGRRARDKERCERPPDADTSRISDTIDLGGGSLPAGRGAPVNVSILLMYDC